MKRIEIKVTTVTRGGHDVLLIACSVCGPVSVDSRPDSTIGMVATQHLLATHGFIGMVKW